MQIAILILVILVALMTVANFAALAIVFKHVKDVDKHASEREIRQFRAFDANVKVDQSLFQAIADAMQQFRAEANKNNEILQNIAALGGSTYQLLTLIGVQGDQAIKH